MILKHIFQNAKIERKRELIEAKELVSVCNERQHFLTCSAQNGYPKYAPSRPLESPMA